MTPPSGTGYTISPINLEFILVVLAVFVALGWPRLGFSFFSRVERALKPLARRRAVAVATVGLTGLLLRLAILPFCPIPNPFVPDDFSFLFAADTFAHGRLTNPTPAMWTHFETMHITMNPTYASMFFPAQGLILAAGKVLFGHSWYGELIIMASMCGAICWMLQAWLPPTWALLGGLLAVLRLSLFSYWINTYTGGGSIGAVGGARVLGALPRFMKTVRLRDGLLMAAGVILLGTSRLYEGTLLCLPVGCFLAWWMLFGSNRPSAEILIRRTTLPLALIVAAAVWMGYYNYRVFASPTTLPYTVNTPQYGIP